MRSIRIIFYQFSKLNMTHTIYYSRFFEAQMASNGRNV